MSNVQHSANTGEWYTPTWVIEFARYVMGGIDLDPMSSEAANRFVKATEYWAHDTVMKLWQARQHRRIFCNPAGSCYISDSVRTGCKRPIRAVNAKTGREYTTKCTCRLVQRAWAELLAKHRATGADVFWVGFSVNQFRTLQPPPGTLITIPPKRINYVDSETMQPVKGCAQDSWLGLLSINDDVRERFSSSGSFRCAGETYPLGRLLEVK